MASAQENLQRFQEISNRGLQDKLSPDMRARYDEALSRGLIKQSQPDNIAQEWLKAHPEKGIDPAVMQGIPDQRAQEVLTDQRIRDRDISSGSYNTELQRLAAQLSSKSEMKDAADFERERVQNPELAALAEEYEKMPLHAAAVAYQGGLRDLGRVLGKKPKPGMQTEDPTVKKSLQLLSDKSDAAAFGKAAGQSAPFVAPAMAATQIPNLAARVATMGGIGALEGGTIAAAEGGDTKDIALASTIGLLVAPLGDVGPAIVNRLGRKALDKPDAVGADDVKLVVDESGEITPEFEKFVNDNNIDFEKDVAGEISKEGITPTKLQDQFSTNNVVDKTDDVGNIAQETAKVATDPNLAGMDKLIRKADPDPERLKAAESLGLTDVPAPVLSKNKSFQAVGGQIAAVPSSTAKVQLEGFADQLGMKADDVIKEMGGSLDTNQASQELLDKIAARRDSLVSNEQKAYDAIRDKVGGGTKVNPKPMIDEMERIALDEVGDPSNIVGIEKRIYNILKKSNGKIPYGVLDRERKEIGAALSKKQGKYRTGETRILNRLYSQLSQLQEGAAKTMGADDLVRSAKDMTIARKQLEADTTTLFGKGLDKSFVPKLSAAMNDITNKKFGEFNKIMNSIPKEDRGKAVATALNGVFTSSRGQVKDFTASKYSSWFKGLQRSPSTYQAFKSNLPEGGMARLEALAKIAEGMEGVTRNKVPTGLVMSLFKDYDKIGGIAGKLYGTAEKLENIPGTSGVVRLTSNVAKLASMSKTPAMQAADELLMSTAFQKAFIDAAANPESIAAKNAVKNLTKTKQYKQWLSAQEPNIAAQVSAVGLIPWLTSEKEE